MKSSVYVFDPTASDEKSRVRGVGRYLQLLKENFTHEFKFVSDFKDFKNFIDFKDSIFINPFFNFLQSPLLMKRIAKRQIAVIHDLIPLKYPEHFPAGIRGNINLYLNKLALNNYDTIVTDSEASKKDIVQILKVEESRVKVVHPCLTKKFMEVSKWKMGVEACQEDRSRKLEKVPTSTHQFPNSPPNLSSNFCLYVGDATWNKNLVNLAKAIKIINVPCLFIGKIFERAVGVASQEISNINPDLIGTKIHSKNQKENNNLTMKQFNNDLVLKHPWNRELSQFIKEAINDKRFIFLGFLDDYKLVKLYQQAKLNILVSRDEGFGFSYLEAANFGCPSVLSDIPVLREISNNQGANFANPNDPNDIANKIGEIYFNPDLRNKLSLEAQQQSKNFSQDIFIKSWKNLI